jgi:hypothetical protein
MSVGSLVEGEKLVKENSMFASRLTRFSEMLRWFKGMACSQHHSSLVQSSTKEGSLLQHCFGRYCLPSNNSRGHLVYFKR